MNYNQFKWTMMQNSLYVPPIIIAWLSKIGVSALCHICPYTKGLVEYLSKRIGLVARPLLMS
jgi:hypothetical protein